jgi:outer membrane protein OmpA-like peptidoglycan-associated protein
MGQDVSRLKELLFENESRTLSDLTHRMDLVFERAGSQERFTASVAGVLDDALRQAEVHRHTELSQAIAPLIVKTIKTEIRGSQDELAEALYPAMGRMVKAYVASAIRDLMDDINRRLESNAFMLRVRSLLSGRPIAELAFAEGQRLTVDEMFLIRRGSGALLGHWPASNGTSAHDRHVSGILTAINEVATEAFDADQAALRRIDLGSGVVYLRASPTSLLAAKCRGAAPASVEQTIDEQFLNGIERLRSQLNGGSEPSERAVNLLLADLAMKLEDAIASQRAKFARQRRILSPAAILFWGIGLLIAGWAGWSAYSSYETWKARDAAERVIAGQSALNGFPVRIAVQDRGAEVSLLGLIPTTADAREATARLRIALPRSHIIDRTAALPRGDIEALQAKIAELTAQAARSDAAARAALDQLGSETSSANAALHHGLKTLDDQVAKANGEAQSGLEALHTALIAADKARHADVEALQSALAEANKARQADVETLRAELARALIPSARTRLETWVHTHAIFFTKETSYRDAQLAATALDELAKLIKDTDVLVRVVGFTDEKGGQERNVPLSLARANKIASELQSRGIPATRLVAVGRNNIEDLSPIVGDASPNRRVEFEIGFDGEAAR